VIDAVEALSADEKGAVLGLARAGVGATTLAGAAGLRCGAALAALGAADEATRAGTLEALAAVVAAPVPAGLERVHPGWIRRALEGERSEIVRAVVAGLPAGVRAAADELLRAREDAPAPRWAAASGPALDELRRAVFAPLVPMPVGPGAAARMPRAHALCALAPAALVDELDRRGAETIGRALAGAPAEALARAAAGVGEALARVVVGAARGDVSNEARAAARAVVASAPADEAARGPARAVGLRVVAREVAAEGAAALAAVAQALPPALGDALLAAGAPS
jgi:hypothetical protein